MIALKKPQGWLEWGLAVFTALAAAYFAQKLISGHPGIDFNYFWLAGNLWAEGHNPYSDIFERRGDILFAGDQNRPIYWVYPPNWSLLSLGLAQLPFETSAQVWKVLNGGFLLLGVAILIATIRRHTPDLTTWRVLLFTGFTLSMSATALTLVLGQTSALMFLGLSFFLMGWLHDRRAFVVTGLVILALKPTVGIVFVVFLLPQPQFWGSLLMAAAAVFAMSFPAFWISGAFASLQGMVSRLDLYGSLDVNVAASTTGMRNLIYAVSGQETGTTGPVVLILALALFLGALWQRQRKADVQLAIAAVLLGSLFAVMPLHSYDALVLAPLILLSLRFSFVSQCLMALLLLGVYRANNLAELTGWTSREAPFFPGATLLSFAAVALILVILTELLVKVSMQRRTA